MTPRDELLHAALDLARRHVAVFPLWGKDPAISNPHPRGSRARRECHGECGRDGHGFYDATTDLVTVACWWGYQTAGANIGGRVPRGQFVLDTDPRSGGHEALAELILEHGPLPETRTTVSGRGDGGTHRFYRRPPGRLVARLAPGLDIKSDLGYTVLPPSYHPDTGRQYTHIDRPVADPPAWLVELVTAPEPEVATAVTTSPRSLFSSFWSPSIADEFGETTSWGEILEPHGWHCLDADPDGDGAAWLHPTHTSACSASIRFGCLFVWSTNTPFEISEPSNPNGYTKFRAYAVLYHDGDMSAAARALREAS